MLFRIPEPYLNSYIAAIKIKFDLIHGPIPVDPNFSQKQQVEHVERGIFRWLVEKERANKRCARDGESENPNRNLIRKGFLRFRFVVFIGIFYLPSDEICYEIIVRAVTNW